MSSKPDAPNVLALLPSVRAGLGSPAFSPAQITCGPDGETREHEGRIVSLKTPAGRFDTADIVDLVPRLQMPELLIVKVDAAQDSLPGNLGRFKCPKVLLVGDTHGPGAPIRKAIGYARSEPFDFVILDDNRDHAPLFAEAGVRNLHWLPGLGCDWTRRELCPAPSRPLAFVGPAGSCDSWRRGVLSHLRGAGLPLEIVHCRPGEPAVRYPDSQVTLNMSLNGELSCRIFEALGAGAFLLTDRLSPASGMRLLFEPGKHLDVWRSPEALVEMIRFYLDHPVDVARIRAEGRAEILRNHQPDKKRRELLELVFSGKSNPLYQLDTRPASTRPPVPAQPKAGPSPSLAAHEWIQDIHGPSRLTTVYCDDSTLARFHSGTELPRLRLRGHADVAPHLKADPGTPGARNSEVLWIGDDIDADGFTHLLSRFTGVHVIAPPESAESLAEWGFFAVERDEQGLGLYTVTRPAAFLRRAWGAGARETVRLLLPRALSISESAGDCLAVAECAALLGLDDLYSGSVRRAVALDRECQTALIRMACIAWGRRDTALAAVAFEEAARCHSLPPGADRLRVELRAALGERLRPYLSLTGHIDVPPAASPMRILVVTNLFPPDGTGPYGRMMGEFARGLLARGHAVRIVAGNAGRPIDVSSAKEADLESRVCRNLSLAGTWTEGGTIPLAGKDQTAAAEAANASRVLREAVAFEADVILVGDLDLLGVGLIHSAIYAGYPVLHAVANPTPGFAEKDQPLSSCYWVAPSSHSVNRALKRAGFAPAHMATVHPGARIDRFYRVFLPDTGALRIACVGDIAASAGVHVLVAALARLHAGGCRITAEIAGDARDPSYAEKLRAACAEGGISGLVSFTGVADRGSLVSLFARSNVLVSAGEVDEPFGVLQLEAMASGLVAVTSGSGCASEIVSDGLDGLVFEPGDAAGLAEKLQLLAREPAVFQRLQSAGQRRAVRLSVDSSVRKIEDLAAELIESSRVPTVEQAAVADAEAGSLASRIGYHASS